MPEKAVGTGRYYGKNTGARSRSRKNRMSLRERFKARFSRRRQRFGAKRGRQEKSKSVVSKKGSGYKGKYYA